jgi:hypothetical protein
MTVPRRALPDHLAVMTDHWGGQHRLPLPRADTCCACRSPSGAALMSLWPSRRLAAG